MDPRALGIPGKEEADREANAAREGRGSTVQQQAFILATNRARGVTEKKAAATTEWEKKRLSAYYGYRGGKADPNEEQ
jgi:hypothetical protein